MANYLWFSGQPSHLFFSTKMSSNPNDVDVHLNAARNTPKEVQTLVSFEQAEVSSFCQRFPCFNAFCTLAPPLELFVCPFILFTSSKFVDRKRNPTHALFRCLLLCCVYHSGRKGTHRVPPTPSVPSAAATVRNFSLSLSLVPSCLFAVLLIAFSTMMHNSAFALNVGTALFTLMHIFTFAPNVGTALYTIVLNSAFAF